MRESPVTRGKCVMKKRRLDVKKDVLEKASIECQQTLWRLLCFALFYFYFSFLFFIYVISTNNYEKNKQWKVESERQI